MFLQISAKPFRTPKPLTTELEIACKTMQIRFQDHLKNILNFGMLFGADIEPKTIKKVIPSIGVLVWFGTLDPRKGPKGHPDFNVIEKNIYRDITILKDRRIWRYKWTPNHHFQDKRNIAYLFVFTARPPSTATTTYLPNVARRNARSD